MTLEISDVVEHSIKQKIGKIIETQHLYGGSQRKFTRIVGKRSSLILLEDNNSRSLDNFVTIGKYLNKIGHIAPDVYEHYWEYGLILMEDLGDLSLELKMKTVEDKFSIYKEVIELLVLFQSSSMRKELPIVVSKNPFDFDKLLGEFQQFSDHFIDDYLTQFQQKKTFDNQKQDLKRAFATLAQDIHNQKKVFMHRDFQSRNLLLHNDKLKIIDFQSAAIGPYSYDLAAVLEDPYVNLSSEFRRKMKLCYLERMKELKFLDIDLSSFWIDYENSAISRLMQAIGAFARLTKAKKPNFEMFILPALRILSEHLNEDNHPEINNFCHYSISLLDSVK